jgi:hypothetical protein
MSGNVLETIWAPAIVGALVGAIVAWLLTHQSDSKHEATEALRSVHESIGQMYYAADGRNDDTTADWSRRFITALARILHGVVGRS